MSIPTRSIPEGDMIPLEEKVSCVRNIQKYTLWERNLTRYTVDFSRENRWDPRQKDPDFGQQLELMHETARRHIYRNNRLITTLESGHRLLQRTIKMAKDRNEKELVEILESIEDEFRIPYE